MRRGHILHLHNRKTDSEKRKRELITYLERLKEKYKQGEITYARYVEIIHEKRNRRTIEEWIHYYHLEALECHRKIQIHIHSQSKKTHFFWILGSIAIVILLALLFKNFTQTGFVSEGNASEIFSERFLDKVNLEFAESEIYEWTPNNQGTINSVSLSGAIRGNEEILVYIEDILILNSSNIKETRTRTITGFSIDDEENSEDSQSETKEESSQEDSSPSQEDSSQDSDSSEDSLNSDTESSEEEIIEEEEKEVIEESNSNETEEEIIEEQEQDSNLNQTETADEGDSQEDSSPSQEDIPSSVIKNFKEACEDSCSNLNLNQESYSIKVEINGNSQLTIKDILYMLSIEQTSEPELPEQPEEIILPETNETIEQNITEINQTLPEINLTSNETINQTEIIEDINATITTIQHQVVIGQPVKWTKKIQLEEKSEVRIKIPKNAENITAYKIQESGTRGIASINEKQQVSITGLAISETSGNGIITRAWNFITNIFTLTGKAVTEIPEEQEIILDDNATQYELEYYTEAPQVIEEEITKGKRITISTQEELGYENILSFTNLEQETLESKIKLYHIIEGERQLTEFTAYDNNENGLIDYIEWTIPHLSEQVYELIIEIANAEHLDENREFIQNIYDEVYQLDDIWSPTINENEYVRVTFVQNLTSINDITIYPRIVNGTPRIEIYEVNSTEIIAEFTSINENEYNKVYLTNLISGSQDTFDLKILNGSLEFDHIIDPGIVIQPAAQDTYATEISPTATYGTQTSLVVDCLDDNKIRSFIQFDLYDVPTSGVTITNAELKIYQYSSADLVTHTIDVYEITEEWDQSTLNWNNQPSINLTNYAQTSISRNAQWVIWNVTDIIKYWYNTDKIINNYGLAIRSYEEFDCASAKTRYFYSSDYTTNTALRPIIIVNWTDNQNPATTLVTPAANYVNDSSEITLIKFQCSATDNAGLKNISLYLTNSNNQNFVLNQTSSISGTSNSSSWNLNLSVGNYTWNCLSCDLGNNCVFATSNRTIKLNWTKPNEAPQVTLNFPENNTQINNTQNVNFNFTAVDDYNLTLSCSIYLDGVLNQTNSSVANNTLTNFLISGISYGAHNWSVNCSDGELSNVSETRYFSINDTLPPTIIFNYQNPADLNLTNFLGPEGVNISYNITDTTAVDNSTVKLYYKTNSTQDNIHFYQNGTAYEGFFPESPIVNGSPTYIWNLDDNQVLPGTYNFGEITMENTPHLSDTLNKHLDYLKIEFYNVSDSKQYSFFEIMANRTSGTGSLRYYYCNSSYTTGNVANSPFCTNFYTETDDTPNHYHSEYSWHLLAPMAIDTGTGTIGNVKVTSTSYLLIRGFQGTTWTYYYITNTSRANAYQTSTNGGNSWTSQTYTVDSHIHQFGENQSLWYYACANDTLGNGNCSETRQDLLEPAGLPPSAPNVYSPEENSTYSVGETININYTEALSPNAYAIDFYNISLMYVNETFVKTIQSNNSLNLSYAWNPAGTDNGEYIIKVEACDVLGQCSFGYSGNFTLAFCGGNGTEQNPYLICTAHDLNNVRQNLSVYYKLNNSIDLTPDYGAGWEPIGDDINPFTGNFNGDSYNVSGLYIDNTAARDYLGLFGYLDSGIISNVGLIDLDITPAGVECTGGLVGKIEKSTINNSFSTGGIGTIGNKIGGLVGCLGEEGLISRSYSTVIIFGGAEIGGLVGRIDVESTGKVIDSYARGAVNGEAYVGGLIGINVKGEIRNSFSTGNVSGSDLVGGLIGGDDGGTYDNSFWDRDTSEQDSSAGGEAKATTDMKKISTFSDAGWDILYNDNELNDNYPYLNWQINNNTAIWYIYPSNTPPQITHVSPINNTNPTEENSTPITFYASVYDANGVSDINVSSVYANFTRTGQTTRENLSCVNISNIDANTMNFSCTINMWYFDEAGDWNVSVYAEDNSGESAINDSTYFQYNILYALTISPNLISFNLQQGTFNQTTDDDPIIINNTGNANLTDKIAINATNLLGEINNSEMIEAENFSVGLSTGGSPPAECTGTTLSSNDENILIKNVILEAGNLSLGGGIAQEELYFCIYQIGLLSSQTYSTQESGSWTITAIMSLALIRISSKRKKKDKKEKIILDDLSIPITIFTNQLGGLEGLVKYLKENLELKYSEIANIINRDDRTIWTAYSKAIKKQPTKVQISKTLVFIPISILRNRKLTIFEAIVIYLKDKGMTYAEIGRLLNRDQRNIWTMYSRAIKKT